MKIKVSESTELQLNHLVAVAEGATDAWRGDGPFWWNGVACIRDFGHDVRFTPSTDWSQGGPIIQQECIELSVVGNSLDGMWVAKSPDWYKTHSGPTPLIAAMRCFVSSRLGEEVEIPEELCK